MNLLRCLPNIRVADRNYLHTVIAVDNTQVMGKVLDVFKQKTGNTFSVYRRPKEFGQRGKHNYDNTNKWVSVNYTLEKAVTKKSFQHFQGNPLYTGNTNCHRRTLQFFLWCRRMTNRTLCFREYTFSIAITALNATNGTKRKLQSVERRSKTWTTPKPVVPKCKFSVATKWIARHESLSRKLSCSRATDT